MFNDSKIPSIDNLNSMLDTVKATSGSLVPFNRLADEENRSEQKRTYQEKQKAETTLHRNLLSRSEKGVSTEFKLTDGSIGTIGTVGVLTNGMMLYYASDIGSKYCMEGVTLLAIDAFFDVK